MKKTIGGDRLGSGKKMKVDLENYGRSTHNLNHGFKSAMACGTLVPFYYNIGLNGDTFDINLESMVRTLPTNGPLFGSFKLQMDIFQIPIRLYQGILHNNPLNIGMDMAKVRLPLFEYKQDTEVDNDGTRQAELRQVASNALIKYLGISGAGQKEQGTIIRRFNALGILSYYDIFKNYYANKQQKTAFVIAPQETLKDAEIIKATYLNSHRTETTCNKDADGNYLVTIAGTYQYIYGHGLSKETITINGASVQDLIDGGQIIWQDTSTEDRAVIYVTRSAGADLLGTPIVVVGATQQNEVKLHEFDLDNIDRMRRDILSMQEIGVPFVIYNHSHEETGHNYLPYGTIVGQTQDGRNYNAFRQNGLVVKTYQSDIFNNWMNTEWIDGDNGIAAITAVSTAGDSFTIDALILANKVYNMLNRIAVSGGTYEDWQEAVYGEDALRHAESPIYCGGMSSEIAFDEVVTTAETETTSAGDTKTNYAGSLAGKGRLVGKKGGNVVIHVKEPSLIMGIVSITPRLNYSQGNSWINTEIFTMDDLHKPSLDAIGFQNLMAEQMDWRATKLTSDNFLRRLAVGKVPAWLNYMTDVDNCYSDFIEYNKAAFMVLNRNYTENTEVAFGEPERFDFTTYIDPRKFNYAFADASIDAQNFWVQIQMDIVARRKMSAKIIPNL